MLPEPSDLTPMSPPNINFENTIEIQLEKLQTKREAKKSTNFLLKRVNFTKINPEGTLGPTWSEVVPIFLELSWHHSGIKVFVKIQTSKYDIT